MPEMIYIVMRPSDDPYYAASPYKVNGKPMAFADKVSAEIYLDAVSQETEPYNDYGLYLLEVQIQPSITVEA